MGIARPRVRVDIDKAAVQALRAQRKERPDGLLGFFASMLTCGAGDPPSQSFSVLHPTSLRLVPGTLTLVLANPGGGSTTLLKMISGRLAPDSGSVRYNETTPQDLHSVHAADARRIASYIDQVDVHEPMLSARETF